MSTIDKLPVLFYTDDPVDEPVLSTGVIIGIVVAAVISGTAAVFVILVVLYVCFIRPKKTAIHDGNIMYTSVKTFSLKC